MSSLETLILALLTTSGLALHAQAEDSVQALIDAAPDGAVIELEARRYSSDKAILFDRRLGLTLRGQAGTELVCLDVLEQVVTIRGSLGIVIEGLSAYHDVPAEGCAGGVIRITSSRAIRIVGCELNGCGTEGVHAWNVVGLTLENNDIHKNSLRGITLDGCVDVTLTGNRVHDNGDEDYAAEATVLVGAAGNTLEGEPWTPPGSSALEPKLFWATSPADLAKLPDDIERLALFDFEDATVLQLVRFESLVELLATLEDGARGVHLGRLADLPALRKLTLEVGGGVRSRVLARNLAELDKLEELRLVAERLERPRFGAEFFTKLLRGDAPLPRLRVLSVADDAIDTSAESLAGLGRLASLEELTFERIHGPAVAASWVEPLAAFSKLRKLELTLVSEELMSVPQLSEDALDAIGQLDQLEVLTLNGADFGAGIDLDFVVDLERLVRLELRLEPMVAVYRGFEAAAYHSVAGLKHLEELILTGIAPEVDLDRCVQSLLELDELRSLTLDFAPPAGLLVRLARPLQQLNLHAELDEDHWTSLAELLRWSNIRSLSINSSGELPGSFLGAASLRELTLARLDVGKIDWDELAPAAEFVNLDLSGCTGVDQRAIASFGQQNPACVIR